jgi:hypothetical protein
MPRIALVIVCVWMALAVTPSAQQPALRTATTTILSTSASAAATVCPCVT